MHKSKLQYIGEKHGLCFGEELLLLTFFKRSICEKENGLPELYSILSIYDANYLQAWAAEKLGQLSEELDLSGELKEIQNHARYILDML